MPQLEPLIPTVLQDDDFLRNPHTSYTKFKRLVKQRWLSTRDPFHVFQGFGFGCAGGWSVLWRRHVNISLGRVVGICDGKRPMRSSLFFSPRSQSHVISTWYMGLKWWAMVFIMSLDLQFQKCSNFALVKRAARRCRQRVPDRASTGHLSR